MCDSITFVSIFQMKKLKLQEMEKKKISHDYAANKEMVDKT